MSEENKDLTSEEVKETSTTSAEEAVETKEEKNATSSEAEEAVETTEEKNEASNEAEDVVDTEEDPKDEKIKELQQAVEENENKYLKLMAEFENFKRRNRQEMELNNKYKDQKFAEDLLPVIDNLERALAIEGEEESFIALNKGVDMVYRNLLESLENHDIKVIDALDQEFDPNFHQAVMTEEVEDKASGLVIEEFQKGYILKDRVIRPSMVKVSE